MPGRLWRSAHDSCREAEDMDSDRAGVGRVLLRGARTARDLPQGHEVGRLDFLCIKRHLTTKKNHFVDT